MLKLPKIDRVSRVGSLAAQRPAWAHYLGQRRRRRMAVGAFSFDPLSVAGLKLWLKADALALTDNSPVDAWADASGSTNGVAQVTGMKMPTFKTNVLNGLPVVRFDGIDDTLFRLAAAGFACTQGHAIFAVLNPTSAVAYGMAVVTNYQANELRQSGAGGVAEWMIPSGFIQVDSADDLTGLWKVWTGTYSVAAQTLELAINSVSQGTQNDPGPLGVGDIYIGSRTDTYHWLGDIAEVLVYDAALSATDRQNIENYLIAKYALS